MKMKQVFYDNYLFLVKMCGTILSIKPTKQCKVKEIFK